MAEEAKVPEAQSEDKSKKKASKINRMSSGDLDKKIETLASANQTKSVYYKHLISRKSEITPK
jgi:hypothetical protein